MFPPGDDELFAWDNPRSYVARELEAVATAVRLEGTDAVDRLRQELRPQTSTEKLPDWEAVFGLAQSRTVRFGSVLARRAQVVARWRESGASTRVNILAAFAAVLGYPPDIIEQSRSALTAKNTHSLPGTPILLPGNGSAIITVPVADNAPVSQAGARLTLVVTMPTLEDLAVTLQTPDGTVKNWPGMPFGSGAAVGATFILYAREFAGSLCDGDWTIRIDNANANDGSLGSGSSLFVEGIGRNEVSDAEGLAANIFAWCVLVDPARLSSAADLGAARALVRRYTPAHCRGYFARKPAAVSGTAGVFDDANAIFDSAVFG